MERNPFIIPPKLVGTAFGHDPNNMIGLWYQLY